MVPARPSHPTRQEDRLFRIRLVETILFKPFYKTKITSVVWIITVMMKMDICQESL
jgi:hypothetical protein